MPGKRLLIAGLGNPGLQYDRTRHNAGFMALDYFATCQGYSISTEKMQGKYAAMRLSGKQVLLVKPQSFMNRSGECASLYAKYFDIAPPAILVVHDDLDLPPGRIKIVSGGGSGGHNGIRSLVSHLGTGDFARLKIGIGHPRDSADTAAMPVERYVLSRFSPEQWQAFQDSLATIADGILLFISQGIEAAMNKINRKVVPSD